MGDSACSYTSRGSSNLVDDMMYTNYKTDHRQEWKRMGFLTMSVVVPQEEKDIVLAESAVRRATYALELLDSTVKTDEMMKKIRWLANRNKMSDVHQRDYDLLKSRVGYKPKADIAAKMVKKSKEARDKATVHGQNFMAVRETDDDAAAMEAGYMVAYSWLSTGYFKLAEAHVARAELGII